MKLERIVTKHDSDGLIRKMFCIGFFLITGVFAQQINIYNPYAAQSYNVGDTMIIEWDADTTISEVIIEYSPDHGMSWLQVTSSGSVRRTYNYWGYYHWAIPDNIDNTPVPSPKGILRIADYNYAAEAFSDTFEIVDSDTVSSGPMLSLSTYQVVCTGDTTFTVNATNSGDDTLPPLSATADAQWVGINVSGSGNEQYIYTTVDTTGLSGGYYSSNVAVTGTGINDSFVIDLDLTADKSGIYISAPVAGEIYTVGDTMMISWSADSKISDVGIEYSPDEGMTWLSLTSSDTISRSSGGWGSYAWHIPENIDGIPVASSQAMMRVYETNGSAHGYSDIFEIYPNDSTVSDTTTSKTALLSPVGDSYYMVGDTMTIEWDADTGINEVILEYSPDDGVSWAFIDSGTITRNSSYWGLYPWKVPREINGMPVRSHHARVKLSDYNKTSWSISGQFTIYDPADTAISRIWYIDASAPDGGDGSRSAPFNTIFAFIGLESGDMIHVAGGYYVLDSGFTIDTDSILILGGWDTSFTWRDPQAHPTIISGEAIDVPDTFFVIAEDEIEFSGFDFVDGAGGAHTALAIAGDSIRRVGLLENRYMGLSTALSINRSAQIKVVHSIFEECNNALHIRAADSVLAKNNTFYGNREGIALVYSGGVLCRNNIFSHNEFALIEEDSLSVFGNVAYNAFFRNGTVLENNGYAADIAIRYPENLVVDPMFLDTTLQKRDLHLQPGSQCIDAGDPNAEFEREPMPNGGRINIGAYGGTEYATVSDTGTVINDSIAPQNPLSLKVTAVDSGIQFRWDPALVQGSDIKNAGIWYRTDRFPQGRQDPMAAKVHVWPVSASSLNMNAPVVGGLPPGPVYYFALYVQDSSGNWSVDAAMDTVVMDSGQMMPYDTLYTKEFLQVSVSAYEDSAALVSIQTGDTTPISGISGIGWGYGHQSDMAPDSTAGSLRTIPYADTSFVVDSFGVKGMWIFGFTVFDSTGRMLPRLIKTYYVGNMAPRTIVTKTRRWGAVRYRVNAIDDKDSLFVFHYSFKKVGDSSTTLADTLLQEGTDTASSIVREFYPLPDGMYRFSAWCSELDGKRDSSVEHSIVTITRATKKRFSMRSRWNMIGIPGRTIDVDSLRTGGVISYWDESSAPRDIYSYYVPSDQIRDMSAGQALWRKSSQPVQIELQPAQLIDSAVTLQLNYNEYGWNQVTSPYPYPVRWPYDSPLWRWDSTQQSVVPAQDTLYPWRGYWVQVPADTTATLQPRPVYSLPQVFAKRMAASYTDEDNWHIRIGLRAVERGSDPYNVLGFCKKASDGRDSLDMDEPPSIGSNRTLFMYQSDENGGRRLAKDIRNNLDSAQRFSVGITPGDYTAHLYVEGTEQHASVYIYLVTSDTVIRMEPGKGYPLDASDEITYRTIFVTRDPHFTRSLPYRFRFAAPVPNPFVRQAVLTYTLPFRWDAHGRIDTDRYRVSLNVIDTRGRIVRTLENEMKSPGSYRVEWNGKTRNGRVVSSGAYFLRLEADALSAVKRVVKIK